MSKLRFDPVTYQFYYRCGAQESEEARAAGFGWDPLRRRYYTEDPGVAICLARRGDTYVKQLLADAVGSMSYQGRTHGNPATTLLRSAVSGLSSTVH
jgi:hypothetical protein